MNWKLIDIEIVKGSVRLAAEAKVPLDDFANLLGVNVSLQGNSVATTELPKNLKPSKPKKPKKPKLKKSQKAKGGKRGKRHYGRGHSKPKKSSEEDEPEEIGAGDEDDDVAEDEPVESASDELFDDAARAQLKANEEKLNELQEKVKDEMKKALSFDAQKVLAAMKRGATRRKTISQQSGVAYSSTHLALKELMGRGLITNPSFGKYNLVTGPGAD